MTINFGDEKRVVIKRKDFQFPIPFEIESQGNKVFMDILACLLPVIENPGMVIVDEFGNSLHNNLAEKVVSFFMEFAKIRRYLSLHTVQILYQTLYSGRIRFTLYPFWEKMAVQ